MSHPQDDYLGQILSREGIPHRDGPSEGEALPPKELAEVAETEPIGDVTVVPETCGSDPWLDAGE